MIVRKIPNVLPKFEDMLDHAITLAEHDINDVDCELKMDFKVLIPNQVNASTGSQRNGARGQAFQFLNQVCKKTRLKGFAKHTAVRY